MAKPTLQRGPYLRTEDLFGDLPQRIMKELEDEYTLLRTELKHADAEIMSLEEENKRLHALLMKYAQRLRSLAETGHREELINEIAAPGPPVARDNAASPPRKRTRAESGDSPSMRKRSHATALQTLQSCRVPGSADTTSTLSNTNSTLDQPPFWVLVDAPTKIQRSSTVAPQSLQTCKDPGLDPVGIVDTPSSAKLSPGE